MMTRVTNPDRRDVFRSVVYILIYVVVIGASAFLLLPKLWYAWAVVVLAGLILLVNWHKQKTAYRCPECDQIYEISFLTDLTAPHGAFGDTGPWLFLRCPHCGKRSKTRVLKKVE
ncbi:hypothetical protein ACFLXB_00735 [Chloroflexota bacterium]